MTDQENTYYKNGVPFFIEVEFSDWTNLVERKLIDLGMTGGEILPGLKVNRVFKQTSTELSSMSTAMMEDLKQLMNKQKEMYSDFISKWEYASNKEEVNKLLNIENASKPIMAKSEDRPVGINSDRIKSYDDVSQFPKF